MKAMKTQDNELVLVTEEIQNKLLNARDQKSFTRAQLANQLKSCFKENISVEQIEEIETRASCMAAVCIVKSIAKALDLEHDKQVKDFFEQCKKAGASGTVNQTTHGEKSPAIHAIGDVNLTFN